MSDCSGSVGFAPELQDLLVRGGGVHAENNLAVPGFRVVQRASNNVGAGWEVHLGVRVGQKVCLGCVHSRLDGGRVVRAPDHHGVGDSSARSIRRRQGHLSGALAGGDGGDQRRHTGGSSSLDGNRLADVRRGEGGGRARQDCRTRTHRPIADDLPVPVRPVGSRGDVEHPGRGGGEACVIACGHSSGSGADIQIGGVTE